MTRRPAALLLALCAGSLPACAGTSSAPRQAPAVAAPAAPAVPDVTSDRGNRVLAPSPVGRIAPEDAPVAPAARR